MISHLTMPLRPGAQRPSGICFPPRGGWGPGRNRERTQPSPEDQKHQNDTEESGLQ